MSLCRRERSRILDLHPGNLCTTIKCTLSDSHLEQQCQQPQPIDNEEYRALSYTWGAAIHTAPILRNGQILEITGNPYYSYIIADGRGGIL